jgi:hypothetical protein
MTIRRLLPATLAPLAVALAVAATPSNARAGVLDSVLQYGEDRLYDFADIFRVRAGIPRHGEGYGAKLRVTALAQLGYVRFNGDYWGMERRAWGWADEDRVEGGVSLLYGSRQEMMAVWGNTFLTGDSLWSEIENRRIIRNLPYWDDGRGRLDSIGVEVATPVLALDLGLYPSEALDFLAGFVLIDIFNDDRMFLENKWEYEFTKPTTLPGPDLEASTRRKAAELDALYSGLEEQRLEEAGQLERVDEDAADSDEDAPEVLPTETGEDTGAEPAPEPPAGE